MEDVDIDSLRGFVAPSILEWLTESEQLTSGLLGDYANIDNFSRAYLRLNLRNWNVAH